MFLIKQELSRLKLELQKVRIEILKERNSSHKEEFAMYQELVYKKIFLEQKINRLIKILHSNNRDLLVHKKFLLQRNGKITPFTLVPPPLADPSKRYISINSPFAKAIRNRKPGDTIRMHMNGRVVVFKILRIENM